MSIGGAVFAGSPFDPEVWEAPLASFVRRPCLAFQPALCKLGFVVNKHIAKRAVYRLPILLAWLWLTASVSAQSRLAPSEPRNAREVASDGAQMPTWKVDPQFLYEDFAFVRVRYTVDGTYGFGGDPETRWLTDTPDSDLNFSWRLQQLTSIRVHPDGDFISLTDDRLHNYPFIYIVEPGRLRFSEAEVTALRKYLLNGGFLMFDDFWGEREWRPLKAELARVFPDREPQELAIDHPIFNCVFPLKQLPQVPNVLTGIRSETTGITYEKGAGPPHYRAIYDDKGRMMVIICHNTDNGDGWEQEGVSEYYFKEFSEKQAYPLGINIIFYSMTH